MSLDHVKIANKCCTGSSKDLIAAFTSTSLSSIYRIPTDTILPISKSRGFVDTFVIHHHKTLTEIKLKSTAITTVKKYIVSASSILPLSFTLPPFPTTVTTIALLYLVLTNVLYLARRSHIRGPNMTFLRLLRIRTFREPNVSLSLYFTTLLAWQIFVLFIFPVSEPLSRLLFDRVTFFYAYPNAGGCGIITEPRGVQDLVGRERVKEQVRLDWHRFRLNIGKVGRDGWRHPPFVEKNLVHIDIPRRGIKHWPWRRKWDYEAVTNGPRCGKKKKKK